MAFDHKYWAWEEWIKMIRRDKCSDVELGKGKQAFGINQSSEKNGKATKILEDNLLAIYEPYMRDNASIRTAKIKEWIDLTAVLSSPDLKYAWAKLKECIYQLGPAAFESFYCMKRAAVVRT
ncbi:hypothetical protein V8E54_004807 [Elaphomyces granulatus]|jgi:hypothetical protein